MDKCQNYMVRPVWGSSSPPQLKSGPSSVTCSLQNLKGVLSLCFWGVHEANSSTTALSLQVFHRCFMANVSIVLFRLRTPYCLHKASRPPHVGFLSSFGTDHQIPFMLFGKPAGTF